MHVGNKCQKLTRTFNGKVDVCVDGPMTHPAVSLVPLGQSSDLANAEQS